MTGGGMAAPLGQVDPDLSCWAWWPLLHAGVETSDPGRLGPVADRALAAALGRLVDRPGGVALAREAERRLPGRWYAAGDVAVTYRGLGETEAEAQVIASALAAARTADEALILGARWNVSGPADKNPVVTSALARARELASSAEDW